MLLLFRVSTISMFGFFLFLFLSNYPGEPCQENVYISTPKKAESINKKQFKFPISCRNLATDKFLCQVLYSLKSC